MRVSALVTLHADTAHWEDARVHSKTGRHLTQLRVFGPGGRFVSAQEPDCEARAGERLLLNQPRRQTEGTPDLPDFILIELYQRLHNLPCLYSPQELWNPIVMGLDQRRLPCAAGLDRVGVNRPLAKQPF